MVGVEVRGSGDGRAWWRGFLGVGRFVGETGRDLERDYRLDRGLGDVYGSKLGDFWV